MNWDEVNKERLFIEKQRKDGECAKCYREQRGAIQMCEIEKICKFDKEAIKEWQEIMNKVY